MAGRLLVFFFQAEDGIRDLTVTGVQTCALPILFLFWWRPSPPLAAGHWSDRHRRSARARSFRVHRMTERRDRKSTRLNSSHSQISYAVFCLKKKNERIAVSQILHFM